MKGFASILLGLCGLYSGTALAAGSPGFPRLAGVLIGSPQNYEDPAFQSQIARLNVALLNTWPAWKGFNSNSATFNGVIRDIKAINSATQIFQYSIVESIGAGQGLAGGAFTVPYNKINAMNWWVYNVGVAGAKSLSQWQGSGGPFYEINITSSAPIDSNGNRWTDWFANWVTETYVAPNPLIDGVYTDSVSWFPFSSSDADWNRDGVADSKHSATTQQLYRQGYQHYFQVLRAKIPSKLLIGNLANWGDPASTLTEMKGLLNGGVIEDIVGASWSVETWGGFAAALNWYRKTMNAVAAPKLVFFQQNIASATDYQAVRYGLTTCLMDDGYYAVSPKDDFHSILWYDEFDSNLGQATSEPPVSSWQKGVYRRDFENGIALVNPRGNGPQTVTLEAGFRKLAGKQAPAVNDGQPVSSITLGERDGIVLLRATSAKKPSPVPLVQIQ